MITVMSRAQPCRAIVWFALAFLARFTLGGVLPSRQDATVHKGSTLEDDPDGIKPLWQQPHKHIITGGSPLQLRHYTPGVRKLYEITERAQLKQYRGCKHILEVTNTTELDDTFFLCPEDVIVSTTGTLSRSEYRMAQEATFGKHMAFAFFSELDFKRPCSHCDADQLKEFRQMFMWLNPEDSTLYNTMRWCAQQRIASMYRDTILHVAELDPDFIFMGDDDTSIDPVQLALYLQRYDPNTPVYAGIMPYGGAGFVLSRKFLQILRFRVSAVHYNWRIVLGSAAGSDAPRVEWFPHAEVAKAQTNISGPVYPTFIEKCVNEMFGGNMCFFNSDWVMEMCIRWTGLFYKHKVNEADERGKWSYFHGHQVPECDLHLGFITCHEMKPTAQRERYQRMKRLRHEAILNITGKAGRGQTAVAASRRHLRGALG